MHHVACYRHRRLESIGGSQSFLWFKRRFEQVDIEMIGSRVPGCDGECHV